MSSFRLMGVNPSWRNSLEIRDTEPQLTNLTIGTFYSKTPDSGLDFRDDNDTLRMWDAFLWEGLEPAEFKPGTVEPVEIRGTIATEVITDGLKNDSGKILMSLLFTGCPEALAGAAGVLTFGAHKYEAHSWKQVEAERYLDAFYRHMYKCHIGEELDPDSGLLHIDHALTNLLFIRELMAGGDNPFDIDNETV